MTSTIRNQKNHDSKAKNTAKKDEHPKFPTTSAGTFVLPSEDDIASLTSSTNKDEHPDKTTGAGTQFWAKIKKDGRPHITAGMGTPSLAKILSLVKRIGNPRDKDGAGTP